MDWKINTVKMTVLPKLIYTFKGFFQNVTIFCRIRQTYSKTYTENQKLKELKLSWKRRIKWNESLYPVLKLKIQYIRQCGDSNGI